jgi:dihydrofolate reductase
MRKIFWFELASLDGYHEDENGGLDWHYVDGEFRAFALAQLGEADTLLFGRRTYEHMAAWWPTEAGRQGDPEIADAMNSMPKVVVSSTRVSSTRCA